MRVLCFDNFSAYVKIKKDWYAVIENISFSLEEGEFAVIVGESGCGKTTLLKSAMGFIENSSGQVLINGKDIYKTDVSKLNIGYVSQEYGLYPTMTVYENIAYPLKTMRCPLDEIDRRVKSFADKLCMRPFLTRKPKQLSGGQQQRVAVARALVKNPRIVFFDEPFSNLDIPTRVEMDKMLKDIHKESNTTFLFVTHNREEALTLADTIIIMEEGKIKHIAKPMELRGEWL